MGLLDLLLRFKNGEFDGGYSDRDSHGTTTTLYIENGIPKRKYVGVSRRFFDNKENERIPPKVEITEYKTDSAIMDFIQRFGFIGELFNFDEDAKAVSSKYYRDQKKQAGRK